MQKTWPRSRALVAVIGVIVAMVAFAGPASAAPYTHQPTISVSTQSPVAGSHLRVCGTDFHALTRVFITLDKHRRLASIKTDRSGSFCKTVKLPSGAHGTHRIIARDRRGDKAAVTIHIVRNHHRKDRDAVSLKGSGTPGSPIGVDRVSFNGTSASASDGAAVIGISAVVGLLLFGGGFMLFSGRHRKNPS